MKTPKNEAYQIKITSPLLRPGIELSTTVSEKYVAPTIAKMLGMVREANEMLEENPPKSGPTRINA